MTESKSMLIAMKDILHMLMTHYRDQKGIHAETIVGAAAALSGEFALRASYPQVPEKAAWILGGPADQLLYSRDDPTAVTMWNAIANSAKKAGADASELPDVAEVVRNTAKAVGSAPFPPLTVANEHYPHEWSPSANPRFRSRIMEIGRQNALSPPVLALALAMVVGTLIELTKQAVPPAIAARLALEIMIGTSRMNPLPEQPTA